MTSQPTHRLVRAVTDLDRSTALAGAIAALAGADGPAAIMDYLYSLAPFSSSLVVAIRGDGPPRHLYDDIPGERRSMVVDAFLKGAYVLDPFYARIQPGLETSLLTLREVQPDQFRKTEYFLNYYSDVRLIDEIGLFAALVAGGHVFYSLGRAYGQQAFSSQERQRLRLALPIIEALSRRQWGNQQIREASGRGFSLEGALERGRFSVLTPREREIAGLILKGHSSKSIAREIGITPGTVSIHRKNSYRKLKTSSQSQLFALFLQTLL